MSDKGDLVADLLAEEVRDRAGAIGILVRDVPHLSVEPLLRRLGALVETGLDLRIAYLLPDGATTKAPNNTGDESFSAEVEQAERWRNDPGVLATILVIATGEEAKLSSLMEFDAVGPAKLKDRLVRRALSGLATANEVQSRWWRMLQRDTSISFSQVLDYFISLSGLDAADVRERASRELSRLGLLPDPALFDVGKESVMRRRLERNREVLSRLQTLTERDRSMIAGKIAQETDTQRRAELRHGLRLLREMRRGGAGTWPTLAEVETLLGVRQRAQAPRPEPERKETSRGNRVHRHGTGHHVTSRRGCEPARHRRHVLWLGGRTRKGGR